MLYIIKFLFYYSPRFFIITKRFQISLSFRSKNITFFIINSNQSCTYDSIQIYFYYDADYCWYATFDNISLNGDTIFTALDGQPGNANPLVFGFAPNMSTLNKDHVPIAYATTASSHVSLKVYDNMGRLVKTLVDAQQPAGEKSVLWDNKDLNKRAVANGVYFLKLEAEGKTAVQKLILVK